MGDKLIRLVPKTKTFLIETTRKMNGQIVMLNKFFPSIVTVTPEFDRMCLVILGLLW